MQKESAAARRGSTTDEGAAKEEEALGIQTPTLQHSLTIPHVRCLWACPHKEEYTKSIEA